MYPNNQACITNYISIWTPVAITNSIAVKLTNKFMVYVKGNIVSKFINKELYKYIILQSSKLKACPKIIKQIFIK